MQGRVREAAAEFAEVLDRRRAALGSDPLDVISTTYRLYWAASRLGRHEEAERGFDNLLAQVEDVLGPLHPLALMVRSRCAWARMWAGKAKEAVRLDEDLLPEQEKVLGAEHPKEALVHLVWVRDRRRILFGEEHLDTKRIVRLVHGLGE